MATARAGAVWTNARAPAHAQASPDDELIIHYLDSTPVNAFATNPDSGNADDVTDASAAAQAQASPDDEFPLVYSANREQYPNSVNDSDDDDDDTVRRLVAPFNAGEDDFFNADSDSDDEDETIKRLVMPARCEEAGRPVTFAPQSVTGDTPPRAAASAADDEIKHAAGDSLSMRLSYLADQESRDTKQMNVLYNHLKFNML